MDDDDYDDSDLLTAGAGATITNHQLKFVGYNPLWLIMTCREADQKEVENQAFANRLPIENVLFFNFHISFPECKLNKEALCTAMVHACIFALQSKVKSFV